MYIKDIFRFVNTLKSQGQGRSTSSKEFEDYFNQASFSLWRRELKKFEETLRVSNYIKNFEVQTNPQGFNQDIDAELGHYESFELLKYIDNTVQDPEIDFVRTPDVLDNQYFSRRKNEQFYPPTEDYPIIKVIGQKVIPFPETFDAYTVSGLKYPAKVVYSTTPSIDGRDYVFDEANSTDTDWPEIAHGELITLICKGLGITLKDDWLVQYDNIQKQGEAA